MFIKITEKGVKVFRYMLYACILALIGTIGLVAFRTAQFPSYQLKVPKCNPQEKTFINGKQQAKLLSEAIKIQTVSFGKDHQSHEAILDFHEWILRSFPSIHSSPLVTREVINGHSLLYKVQGSDPSLLPYMLAAHMDVVPVSNDTLRAWLASPFDGVIRDGYVWGRGAMDDKAGLISILGALENMLEVKHKFIRTFYLGFGHDEEVGGESGAAHIASVLKSRDIQFEFIMDEGTMVMEKALSGLQDKPIALIGVAEKGNMMLKLTVLGEGGHSSIPPTETPIGILSAALSKIEQNPFPANIGQDSIFNSMIEHLASEARFPFNIVYSNAWLFGPVLRSYLLANPVTASLVRTSTAITSVQGGIKDNVIPSHATAKINFRIEPSDTPVSVFSHVKKVINDMRVFIEMTDEPFSASPVSPHSKTDFGFSVIRDSILRTVDANVAPNLLMGNTDTRHYWDLSAFIYRFRPYVLTMEDTKGFHGTNERLSVKNVETAVNFFYHLIKSADQPTDDFFRTNVVHDEL